MQHVSKIYIHAEGFVQGLQVSSKLNKKLFDTEFMFSITQWNLKNFKTILHWKFNQVIENLLLHNRLGFPWTPPGLGNVVLHERCKMNLVHDVSMMILTA